MRGKMETTGIWSHAIRQLIMIDKSQCYSKLNLHMKTFSTVISFATLKQDKKYVLSVVSLPAVRLKCSLSRQKTKVFQSCKC